MTETLSAADKIAVIGKAAKAASFQIANASTQQKNAVLLKLARSETRSAKLSTSVLSPPALKWAECAHRSALWRLFMNPVRT